MYNLFIMEIFSEVLGNIHQADWHEKYHQCEIESIYLDQWTAQKSRFLGKSDAGNEYPVALKRHTQVQDGDVLAYDADNKKMIVIRLNLSKVLVIDLAGIASKDHETIIRTSVELGHAIGNQHWPAVIKGTKVYVPLTVDEKVMLSVLDTHNIDGITYEFEEGQTVLPYMSPADVRRLFGGAGHDNTDLEHHHHHHGGHDHHHDHDGHHHHHHD